MNIWERARHTAKQGWETEGCRQFWWTGVVAAHFLCPSLSASRTSHGSFPGHRYSPVYTNFFLLHQGLGFNTRGPGNSWPTPDKTLGEATDAQGLVFMKESGISQGFGVLSG